MAKLTIRVEGMQQALRSLDKVKAATAQKQLGEVLYKSARTIAHYASDIAPVGETGNLRRSLVAGRARRAGGNLPPAAYALVSKKFAPHLHLVAFGTKPHLVSPKRRKRLLLRGARHPVSGAVSHPGARGNDFFQRTVRDTRGIVRSAIREEMKRIIRMAASGR